MGRKTFRKEIVTLETIEKINPENKKMVAKFLKDKATRSSPTTIKGYQSDANIFFTWNLLENENKEFHKIKKLEFSDFFSYAAETLMWGSSRMNRLRSFLSSLSIFIEKFFDEDEKYEGFRNVVLKTIESSPKELRREKTILSNEEVESILKYLEETDSQRACWLALAVTSGARFAELLRFTTDIIDENTTAFGDLFLETLRPIQTKGRGRTGKMIKKYILRDRFLPYYDKWVIDRQVIMDKNNKNHNSLFIKDNGDPATEGTVRSWVESIENKFGLSIYPHCLRHFVVTLYSKKNIPPMLIKELIGWSSLEMVNIYDDTTASNKVWSELDNLKA